MNSCKSFAKKYPVLLAALTFVFVYIMIKVTSLIPDGAYSDGIGEALVAALTLALTYLFLGKEKVRFRKEGFGYTFRLFRTFLVSLTIFVFLLVAVSFLDEVEITGIPAKLLNVLLLGGFVGICEEFSFRGLIFGGILQKLGNSKKGIIAAAIISGLLFGFMHVIGSVFDGEVTSPDTVLTAVLKTCQTGIFGVILAFAYYKTRNLYAVAAVHSLNDLILFMLSIPKSAESGSYVGSAGQTAPMAISYVVFTLIMVPILLKCFWDLKEKDALPFDDDFLPRAVPFEKRAKKKRAQRS